MRIDPRRNQRSQRPSKLPTVATASGRQLTCYPATVHAFIIDRADRGLLLRRPGQPGWETITSILEPGETVPEAALRAVKEAAGQQFLTAFLTVLDTFTFVFDANLPPFLSICCLMRYHRGEVRPGKDVQGAEFRWWELFELDQMDFAVPRARWDLLTRAVDMSRFLQDARTSEPEEEVRGSDDPDFY